MSRIVFISAALLSVLAVSAPATMIEVPLPGLLGTYPVSESNLTRTVTFHLVDPPSIVYSVSFSASGTTEVGLLDCQGVLSPWPTMLSASMEDTPAHYWFADFDMPLAPGAYASAVAFRAVPPSGSTWGFLLDGTAEINLSGGPSGYIATCSPASAPPTLTVTRAVLIIDGEFPIRNEPSTWGKIKAFYR